MKYILSCLAFVFLLVACDITEEEHSAPGTTTLQKTAQTCPDYSYIKDVRALNNQVRITIWTDVNQFMGVYLHDRSHQNLTQIGILELTAGLNVIHWTPTIQLEVDETYLVIAWATKLNCQSMTYSFRWR